jgi:hypothetical protein
LEFSVTALTSKQIAGGFADNGSASARAFAAPAARQPARIGKPQRLFSAELDGAVPASRPQAAAPLAGAFGFMAWRS